MLKSEVMKSAPLHPQESSRLESLHALNILDQLPNKKFDDIVAIAAFVCATPIALITLVDEKQQYFKAKVGLDVTETSRDVAFCAHTILQSKPLIVNDAHLDQRFFDNPLVVNAPHIRSYAGVPLYSPDGYPIGTICVIDTKPRELGAEQISILTALAREVTGILELKTKIKALEKSQTQIQSQAQESQALLDGVPSLIGHWSSDLKLINANAVYQTFFGPLASTKGQHARVVLGEELYQKNIPHINEVMKGHHVQFEREIMKVDGSKAFALFSFVPHFINGKVESFFSISTDITEVKRAEHLRRELEARLIKSDRMSALGEIACGIAHEINNPLAIINLKLMLLKEKVLDPEISKEQLIAELEKLESTAQRIVKIVKGLQTYSRNSEQDPLQKSPLLSIINDSVVLCQERLKSGQVELTVSCDPSFMVECHPAQISQVIINLIINGVDAISSID
jgi:nitrogen-specific signal transduction histidine kinase